MRFYQTQHPFYCGIDLHANQMYACVIDHDGKKHLHRNYKTRNSTSFFDDITPFGSDLIQKGTYHASDSCRDNWAVCLQGQAILEKAERKRFGSLRLPGMLSSASVRLSSH